MKIEVGKMLVVRRGRKVIFSAAAERIESVYVRASRVHEWPTLLRFLPKFPVRLRTILIADKHERVALDAYYDQPLQPTIEWLETNGWNIQESIEKATKTPYVKVEVDRLAR